MTTLGEAESAAEPIDGEWLVVAPPLNEDEPEADEIETTNEAVAADIEDTTMPEAAELSSGFAESPDESVVLVQAPEPAQEAAVAVLQSDDEVERERQEDGAVASSADEEARNGADGDGKDGAGDDGIHREERVSMIGAESADDGRGEPRKGWWTRFMN